MLAHACKSYSNPELTDAEAYYHGFGQISVFHSVIDARSAGTRICHVTCFHASFLLTASHSCSTYGLT
jgi:hypothetical protein